MVKSVISSIGMALTLVKLGHTLSNIQSIGSLKIYILIVVIRVEKIVDGHETVILFIFRLGVVYIVMLILIFSHVLILMMIGLLLCRRYCMFPIVLFVGIVNL